MPKPWMLKTLLNCGSIVLATALAMVVPLGGQTDKNKAANQLQASIKPPTGGLPVVQDPNYIIGPQDVIDISVWKEPDLSRMVPVRPDGKISLPLLNDVQAAGLTPTQLGAQITANLTQYVTNPQVTVIVSQINSQRIYILGEVARPGTYALIPDMNVLQALSNAGGLTAFAKSKKVYILRQDNAKEQKIPFNYKNLISGKDTGDNIALKAGDTIVVP